MNCQDFDLDGDHDVDLQDIADYFNDICCLDSNCIRPITLQELPCNE